MKSVDTKNLAYVLLDMTDGKTEEEVAKSLKDFAKYLAQKNMLSQTEKIIAHYRDLYNKKHNIVEATITLTSRLPEKTRISLREALKKKYQAREVHMLEKVDARIMGGMKIKIDDQVTDLTLQHTLNQLETQLLK